MDNYGDKEQAVKLRVPFIKCQNAGLIREFDDNYYDKIRVYRSRFITNIGSAVDFSMRIRRLPSLIVEHIYFEDLQLRDEENALPIEENGDIPDDLLFSYIRASDIDLIKFAGKYHEKGIEIGISKKDLEIWLRIRDFTDEELNTIENELGLV